MAEPLVPENVLRFLTSGGFLVGFVLLVVVILTSIFLLRRRKSERLPPPIDLHIDLTQLPQGGPSLDMSCVEFYGTPVRIAVLIVAAAGRSHPLGETADVIRELDNLTPGLTEAVISHRPEIYRWPNQLSTQGFTHSFFNNVALPGDHGKGTPWCSMAGRFEAADRQLLVGLACVADKPNALSQIAVAHAGQWLDIFRVKL